MLIEYIVAGGILFALVFIYNLCSTIWYGCVYTPWALLFSESAKQSIIIYVMLVALYALVMGGL